MSEHTFDVSSPMEADQHRPDPTPGSAGSRRAAGPGLAPRAWGAPRASHSFGCASRRKSLLGDHFGCASELHTGSKIDAGGLVVFIPACTRAGLCREAPPSPDCESSRLKFRGLWRSSVLCFGAAPYLQREGAAA